MSLFGFGLHVSDFTTIHAPPNLFIAENLHEEEEVVEENEEEDEEEDDDVDSETTTNMNLDLNLDSLLSTTTRQKRKKLTLSKATKEIFKIGWPTMLQNVSAAIASIFAIYLVAKHENTTAVAAYGLASSLCSVTGHCLLWGIGGALDTLSSQSFGAKKIARIGELWWRCVAVLICTCWFPAVCVWSRAELILTSCLHFPRDVSHLVEVYAMVYAPGLLAQCLSCACLKTLLACKKSETVAKISFLCTPLTMVLTYVCIAKFKLGFVGAPLALALVDICKAICYCLSTFVFDNDVKKCFKKGKGTRTIFKSAFSEWSSFFKIAAPNLILSIMEWWAWDVIFFLSGKLPNAKDTLAAQTIQINSMIVVYNIAGCVCRGSSSCVGNSIGAKQPKDAKTYAKATLISAFIGTMLMSLLYYLFGFELLQKLYVDENDHATSVIMDEYVKPLTSLVSLFMLFDGVQVALSGVITGAGYQKVTMPALLISYWVIGLPTGIFLAFSQKMSLVGLWVGMIIGVVLHCSAVTVVVFGRTFLNLKKSWTIDFPTACARAAAENATFLDDDEEDCDGDEEEKHENYDEDDDEIAVADEKQQVLAL